MSLLALQLGIMFGNPLDPEPVWHIRMQGDPMAKHPSSHKKRPKKKKGKKR